MNGQLLLASILGLTVATAASSSSGDSPKHPRAFFGASCSTVKPDWDAAGLPQALVIGEAGQKMLLHRDFPKNCGPKDKSCDGKGYVITGDLVTIGQQCGEWTDVEFDGVGRSWGWVETSLLKRSSKSSGKASESRAQTLNGVVVRCDSEIQSLIILRMSEEDTDAAGNARNNAAAHADGTVLSEHGDTADCQWKDGTELRIRYGLSPTYPYGMGGSCEETYVSLWRNKSKWLKAVTIVGDDRQTSRVVISGKGMQLCTVPGDQCKLGSSEGPDHEVCEFTSTARVPAARDVVEYPPPGKERTATGGLVLLQSQEESLCKAIQASGSFKWGAETSLPDGFARIAPAESGPFPEEEGAAHQWLHFDFDNSGKSSWVISQGEIDHFHDGDEYLAFDKKGLEKLKPGKPDDQDFDANAAFDIPFGWLTCAKAQGRAAGEDEDCRVNQDLPVDIKDYEGEKIELSPRYVSVTPFTYGKTTYFMVSGASGHVGDNVGIVLHPKPKSLPQISCAMEQIQPNF